MCYHFKKEGHTRKVCSDRQNKHGGKDNSNASIVQDECRNAWTLKFDAFVSTGLETTSACDDSLFFLWTDSCCATLSCLNLSWLSAIMPMSQPKKHHTYETQWTE